MKAKFNIMQLLLMILIFGIIYFVIWIIFLSDGPFQLGNGLEKDDWLIFLGGYLSFVGTISVSFMVIYQNKNLHFTENERTRYSQLPYLRIKPANVNDDLKVTNGNYIFDFPSLVYENNKFVWKGKETGQIALCPINQAAHEAIYKIENFGLGHAMKFSIHSNDSDYYYRDHLKINEKHFFRVDLGSLNKVNQNISLTAKFFDIYNNSYQQKHLCEFVITGSIFKFDIAQEQFEPVLVK